MQKSENTLREGLCQWGGGTAGEMGGGASGRELEVGHQQVQPRHLLRVFASLLFPPLPLPVLFIVIVVIFARIPLLLSLRSVVGDVPHQQDLGAYAAHDGCVPQAHNCAAGRVRERGGLAAWGTGLGRTSTRWSAGGLAGEGGVEERMRGEFGKCESGEGGGGSR